MVFCLHLFRRDDTLYDTFFVDNKCRTERAHILAAAHALLTPCAKFLGQFMFRISNQREGKLVFLNKLLVRLLVVDAYTYHFITCLAQFIVIVTQVACLSGAARGHVFRIEIKHHFTPFVIAQMYFFPVLVHAQALSPTIISLINNE